MRAKNLAFAALLVAAALSSGCGFESSSPVRHAISGPASAAPQLTAPTVAAPMLIELSEPSSPREDEIVDLSLG